MKDKIEPGEEMKITVQDLVHSIKPKDLKKALGSKSLWKQIRSIYYELNDANDLSFNEREIHFKINETIKESGTKVVDASIVIEKCDCYEKCDAESHEVCFCNNCVLSYLVYDEDLYKYGSDNILLTILFTMKAIRTNYEESVNEEALN